MMEADISHALEMMLKEAKNVHEKYQNERAVFPDRISIGYCIYSPDKISVKTMYLQDCSRAWRNEIGQAKRYTSGKSIYKDTLGFIACKSLGAYGYIRINENIHVYDPELNEVFRVSIVKDGPKGRHLTFYSGTNYWGYFKTGSFIYNQNFVIRLHNDTVLPVRLYPGNTLGCVLAMFNLLTLGMVGRWLGCRYEDTLVVSGCEYNKNPNAWNEEELNYFFAHLLLRLVFYDTEMAVMVE